MVVIRTDKWLQHEPIEICEKLSTYFSGLPSREIYNQLVSHGFYRKLNVRENSEEGLKEKRTWDYVKRIEKKLQREWKGPDIPIFIFPSDQLNSRIKNEYNGKSGLAYKDKLFLFLSGKNSYAEIEALFTHEYNHVCRLTKYKKNEKDFTLLDVIILEGLAENAVRERFGEKELAPWTKYYNEEELNQLWKKYIIPNKDLKKNHPKHREILYGYGFLPRMTGYCVGYHVVKKYLSTHNQNTSEVISYETEVFTKGL